MSKVLAQCSVCEEPIYDDEVYVKVPSWGYCHHDCVEIVDPHDSFPYAEESDYSLNGIFGDVIGEIEKVLTIR